MALVGEDREIGAPESTDDALASWGALDEKVAGDGTRVWGHSDPGEGSEPAAQSDAWAAGCGASFGKRWSSIWRHGSLKRSTAAGSPFQVPSQR